MSPLEEESEIDVFESYKKQNAPPLVSDSSLFPVQIQNSAIVEATCMNVKMQFGER